MIPRFCAESARFILLEVWAMDIDTSAFFALVVINGHIVKNRLSVAPMTRISATQDGRATETMTRYYERFARVASGRSCGSAFGRNSAAERCVRTSVGCKQNEVQM
jgi:2,4-dienoyl-CoA reductase-like NADH-dependent reductase (Old Yellow Enzyme family)